MTLTFRYGREDEEVMGLKFCNEAVMCLAQLYPPYSGSDHQENMTPLQVGMQNNHNRIIEHRFITVFMIFLENGISVKLTDFFVL